MGACTDCHDAQAEVWYFSDIIFPSNKWTFVKDANGIKGDAASIGGIAVPRSIHSHVHCRFIDDFHTKIEITLRLHRVILAILNGPLSAKTQPLILSNPTRAGWNSIREFFLGLSLGLKLPPAYYYHRDSLFPFPKEHWPYWLFPTLTVAERP